MIHGFVFETNKIFDTGTRGKDGLGQRAGTPNLARPSDRGYHAKPVT